MYRSTFFKTNLLKTFDKQNVFYVAYVGNHLHKDVERPIFKYGISTDIYSRIHTAHRKTFQQFEVQTIQITDKKELIESSFEKELKIRELHLRMKFNGKSQTELFYVDENYSIEDMLNITYELVKHQECYTPLSNIKTKLI